MEWVLIIMMNAWNSQSAPAVTSVDFQTEAACDKARDAVKAAEPEYTVVTPLCVARDD